MNSLLGDPRLEKDNCNCYVSKLSDYKQFVIRYGAHDPNCPVYRPSRDPIDQLKDGYTRQHQGTNYRMAGFSSPAGTYPGERTTWETE